MSELIAPSVIPVRASGEDSGIHLRAAPSSDGFRCLLAGSDHRNDGEDEAQL